MRISKDNWAIFSVKTREPRIDPKPPYQRGPVWSLSQRQLFIDSILRGFDIPKLYLSRISNTPYQYEVVDGQQRLRAIWAFYRGEYPLSNDADPIGKTEIAGKKFDELSDDLKDVFEGYNLSIIIFEDSLDEEIEEMFVRLQNGVPLNSAEKRNAIYGAMRDFVRETINSHPFFTESLAFANRRYSHDELLAQMTLLEFRGHLTTVKHEQLKDIYGEKRVFSKADDRKASKIKRVLAFLREAFPRRMPELGKTNALSLYVLASSLLDKYAITHRAPEFGTWFIGFEANRREDEAKEGDSRSADLTAYQLALIQQSASQTALEQRHKVLLESLVSTLENLQLLDDQRQFTEEQRKVIFYKYDKKCVNPFDNPDCSVTCDWDNFHADHKVPHSAGGKTVVSNGQLLCVSCNLKKGNRPQAA